MTPGGVNKKKGSLRTPDSFGVAYFALRAWIVTCFARRCESVPGSCDKNFLFLTPRKTSKAIHLRCAGPAQFSSVHLAKKGEPEGLPKWGMSTYLDRMLPSSVSGGRTTKRTSIGKGRGSHLFSGTL
jgi:hypothetical protein